MATRRIESNPASNDAALAYHINPQTFSRDCLLNVVETEIKRMIKGEPRTILLIGNPSNPITPPPVILEFNQKDIKEGYVPFSKPEQRRFREEVVITAQHAQEIVILEGRRKKPHKKIEHDIFEQYINNKPGLHLRRPRKKIG